MKFPFPCIITVTEEFFVDIMAEEYPEPVVHKLDAFVVDTHLIDIDGAKHVIHETIDLNGVHRLVSSDEIEYDYQELKKQFNTL